MDPLLTQDEAAAVLNVQPRTLENWRRLRKGPPFIRIDGKVVRYRPRDLEAYISARVVTAGPR